MFKLPAQVPILGTTTPSSTDMPATSKQSPMKVLVSLSPVPVLPAKSVRKQAALLRSKSQRINKIPATKQSVVPSISVPKDSCAECFVSYRTTKSKDDRLECILCKQWFHESCSMYDNKCVNYGRQEKRLAHLQISHSQPDFH